MQFESYDPRFSNIVIPPATLDKLWTGGRWTEGPVWFGDSRTLLFSDLPNDRMLQWVEGIGTREFRGPGACNVYRCDPADGALTVVAGDFVRPNGIAFSPDEKTLYIADSSVTHDPQGNHHIRAFDVVDGQRLANGRVFCEINPGFPDGFRLDVDGRIWCSSGDGVQVFAPDGTRLGKILMPEHVSNVCFGGLRKNRLFITATTSLYAVYVGVNGV